MGARFGRTAVGRNRSLSATGALNGIGRQACYQLNVVVGYFKELRNRRNKNAKKCTTSVPYCEARGQKLCISLSSSDFSIVLKHTVVVCLLYCYIFDCFSRRFGQLKMEVVQADRTEAVSSRRLSEVNRE